MRRPGTNGFASTQLGMAIGHSAAGRDQALQGRGQLLESAMAGGDANAGGGADADHARLQFGDLGKGVVDHVLDGTDLGGDFVSGMFDLLFAHDLLPSRTRFARPG